MKLTFTSPFPTALEKEVKKMLAPFGAILSHRLEDLEITFVAEPEGESAPTGAVAAISAQHHYRSAVLHVFPVFLLYSSLEQKRVIAHEMAHILTAAMRAEVEKIIKHYVPEGVREYVFDVFDDREESFVDDLARFLVNTLDSRGEKK